MENDFYQPEFGVAYAFHLSIIPNTLYIANSTKKQ